MGENERGGRWGRYETDRAGKMEEWEGKIIRDREK